MTIPTWTCLILSDLSEAKWGRAWIVEISVWHNRQEQSSSIKKQRIKNKGSNLNEGKCFNYSAYVYVKQSVHDFMMNKIKQPTDLKVKEI
jgi:hypothetical protein